MPIPQLMEYRPGQTTQAPAIRDMSGEWRAFMGMPGTDDVQVLASLSAYASAPADEAWVYSCIQRRAISAQSVPLRVYVKSGKERVPADQSGNGAAKDLQFLLDNVNDTMTGSDMRGLTEAGMCAWGAGWWKKSRGRLGGPPQELWFLRAPDVQITKGPAGRILSVRWQDSTVGAAPEDYKYKDVIYFRSFNLRDPTEPLSPLSPIRYSVAVNRQAGIQTSSLLANWGIPPLAWVAPPGAQITKQDVSLIRRFMRQFRGPSNAGKTAVLPEGLEPKVISLTPKDADWLLARKVSRMEICAALGVPLPLAGDDEKNSVYANLRDAERIFWRSTMIPELDRMADYLNNWLVPDFDPERHTIEIAYDYTGIDALETPVEQQIIAWQGMLDRTVVTPNQFRRHFAPYFAELSGDVQWGDEPYLWTRLQPLADFAQTLPADDTAGLAKPSAPALPNATSGTAPDPAAAPSSPALSGLRSLALYRHPAVRAYLAAGGALPLDAVSLVGAPLAEGARKHIETGLRRRYSGDQILDGVPAERFPPITETVA